MIYLLRKTMLRDKEQIELFHAGSCIIIPAWSFTNQFRRNVMKNALISLTSSIILIMTSLAAFGQDDSQFLTYRQKLMQSNATHMGVIGQIMQKGLPFKNHVSSHATVIQQNSMLFEEAWKKQITEGKTDSKPEVWSNWAGFVQAASNSGKAAAELARASEAQMMDKMRALGGTCGACHRNFRKPKAQRFKR